MRCKMTKHLSILGHYTANPKCKIHRIIFVYIYAKNKLTYIYYIERNKYWHIVQEQVLYTFDDNLRQS